MFRFSARSIVLSAAALLAVAGAAQAQVGYGVNASGQLFRFSLTNPNAAVTNIGAALPFVPEGIDFRPGSETLYAIDVGPNVTQVYTININTGAATPVGGGFTSSGSFMGNAYDLTSSASFGFDVNPTTLQGGDGSFRIRLIGTNNSNLRLNSLTGGIAAVDGNLAIGAAAPFADAAAYTNSNNLTAGGTTQLFVLDARNDSLYLQDPPNNGTLGLIGPMGFSVDADPGISFDILTDPSDADATIGGDTGWAVLRRQATQSGAYLLYNVNLATGEITNGALVGVDGGPAADFTGGLATIIPAPGAVAFLGLGALALVRRRR